MYSLEDKKKLIKIALYNRAMLKEAYFGEGIVKGIKRYLKPSLESRMARTVQRSAALDKEIADIGLERLAKRKGKIFDEFDELVKSNNSILRSNPVPKAAREDIVGNMLHDYKPKPQLKPEIRPTQGPQPIHGPFRAQKTNVVQGPWSAKGSNAAQGARPVQPNQGWQAEAAAPKVVKEEPALRVVKEEPAKKTVGVADDTVNSNVAKATDGTAGDGAAGVAEWIKNNPAYMATGAGGMAAGAILDRDSGGRGGGININQQAGGRPF